jgi:hypothetical protein
MANGYPSLEELISARRTGGPGEVIQSGLEGFLAGRKRRQEEDEAKATAILNNAKLRLQQQAEQREGRQLQAGLIPAPHSLTGAEATPEVQKTLMEKKPKYTKAGEAEENGKKYILFAQEGDPTKVVRISAGVAGQDNKLTAKQNDHLGKLSGAENLLKNVEELLNKVPSGSAGLVQEGLSSNIAARGALAIPEARVYEQVAPGAAVGIYRAVTRDDRLSDADAASRARPLLPFPGEQEPVRRLKLQFVKQLIEDQKAGTAFGGNPDSSAIERAIVAQSKFVQENLGQGQQGGAQPQIRIIRRRPAGSQ